MNPWRRRHSLSDILLCWIVGIILLGAHLVYAEPPEGDGQECDANDGVCQQSQPTRRERPQRHSKLCQHSLGIPIKQNYNGGMSAQAYKPNAPMKLNVCKVDPSHKMSHIVAHWPLWRSRYNDAVPIVVRGKIYSCGGPSLVNDATTMEVWQPRPDGTLSSLRPGVEEGVCRASVPVVTNTDADGEFSNYLGRLQYDTLAPGSPGVLNGLVPSNSRDYPPYGPGTISMHLAIEGHRPWMGQLDTSELEEWMLRKDSGGRFRFRGRDVRPHATRGASDSIGALGGIEIQSVKKISRPGYHLALEVEMNVFVTPAGENETSRGDSRGRSLDAAFCSSGYLSWMFAFFKEPIAVCFPSLLDFFAL